MKITKPWTDSSPVLSIWIARGGRNARSVSEGSAGADGKEENYFPTPIALPLIAPLSLWLRLRDDLRPVRPVKKRNIAGMPLFYKEKANQFGENNSNIFLSDQIHQCNLILSTCVDFPNHSLGHAREHSSHCFYWLVVYITKNRTKGHKYYSLVPSPFHKLF